MVSVVVQDLEIVCRDYGALSFWAWSCYQGSSWPSSHIVAQGRRMSGVDRFGSGRGRETAVCASDAGTDKRACIG
jgi:hypothetical protein